MTRIFDYVAEKNREREKSVIELIAESIKELCTIFFQFSGREKTMDIRRRYRK